MRVLQWLFYLLALSSFGFLVLHHTLILQLGLVALVTWFLLVTLQEYRKTALPYRAIVRDTSLFFFFLLTRPQKWLFKDIQTTRKNASH